MKKKYFTPEMEEMEFETPVLLEGSEAEKQKEGEGIITCDDDEEA